MVREYDNPDLRRVAFIGTYTPRRCGIATFTADLLQAVGRHAAGTEWSAIAMSDRPEGYDYPAPVRFEINQKSVTDYRLAVDSLNMSGVDLVCVQHEFGIYGGSNGRYVLDLLQNLRMPLITTLHTVVREPNTVQREILAALSAYSDRVVVMSETAGRILREVYGVADQGIAVIPHGVPDLPFLDPAYHKDQFGMLGKKVILTFGLISRGKGIEYMIDALPEVIRADPEVVFVVAGATHPQVLCREGEAYRLALAQRASDLAVDDHVVFYNQFIDATTLTELLSAADICVTPYLNPEQVVSGVLSYALGAGKAVVSTPFWYAEEMLAAGRGKLVPFRDANALAGAVIGLLARETERDAMRKKAYEHAREMTWSRVAERYLALFRQVRRDRALRPRRNFQAKTLHAARPELPGLRLDHLRVLTDDVGILQHAYFTVPDRTHGYCTDDNARALAVTVMAEHQPSGATETIQLAYRYLGFLAHAFSETNSRFRNFMTYERTWQEEVGSEDSHGRAMCALGRTILGTGVDDLANAAVALFERALPGVPDLLSLRARALCLIGADAYLKRFNGASDVRRIRRDLADGLFNVFREHADEDWPWPEDALTYANGLLPEALIVSGEALDRPEIVECGLRTLRWLTRLQTDPKGHFVPIGNRGWFSRGGARARFDQQPIEAQHMVDACVAAYGVTGDPGWIAEARRFVAWFLGRNDLQQPVCDNKTGGCRDGIGATGVNQNQGAESTLAWLHTLLAFHSLAAAEASTRRAIEPARL